MLIVRRMLALLLLGGVTAQGEALFNNKDLSGWHCVPAELLERHWAVGEEMIVGENRDQKGSVLWTDRDFGDFELAVDFKTPSPDYDSGVFLRKSSHQVQIGVSRSLRKDLTGCIYAPEDGKGFYPAVSGQVAEHHKLGEWNTLQMKVQGKRIVVTLNGAPSVDYVGETLAATGKIGLQLHAGVHQQMFFRNLQVRELAPGAKATKKPNVVIIYGDDVGYGDLGCYGAEKIPTPHLDRMAAEGLRFTDAHCSAATCTPSRYSLLTGEMAFRQEGTGILAGNARMAVRPEQFTLGDTFREAGYRTGVVGKWHLGLGDGQIDWNGAVKPGPLEIGFDSCFILPATNDRVPCVYLENHHIVNLDPADPITVSYRGGPIADDVPGTEYPVATRTPEAMTYYSSTHGHNNSVINGIGRIGHMKGGKSALWNDEEMADVLVAKASEFMQASKEEPFFLFFSSQDIHVPRTPHPRFRGKSDLGYRGDAMVQLDWTVGAILKALKENGVDENTLVIFSSDNGPVYDDGYADGTTVKTSTREVDRGHDGSGPYRGGKYQIYEGGTRVPLIIRWPAAIEPGVSEALVSQVDFLKSFANKFSVEIPEGAARDSRDTGKAFLGEDPEGSEIILEQARNLAIRKGNWKYFDNAPLKGKGGKNGSPLKGQLYDVVNDPGESQELSAKHPEVAQELSELLNRYRKIGLAEEIEIEPR